jgi:hypothetical protein
MNKREQLLTCARGILEIPAQWLIPGYIPLGNVTVFEGNGGDGKSMMGIEIIAKVSRGEKVFFDHSSAAPVIGGSVILAAEDAYESILRPKLRLADADLGKVFFLPPSVKIPDDVDRIEEELHQLANNNIRIFFIDPLSSFTTKSLTVESSSRQILDRLGKLAHKFNLAVIVVRHLTKNESSSLCHRGLGSVGIGARARSAFMFLPDPKDNTVKLMIHVKHNWSAEQPTPRFEPKVVSTVIGKGNETQQVDFALVDPLNYSLLTVADFTEKKRTDTGKLERAQNVLKSMPVGTEIALADLLDETGCGRRTLDTAKGILVGMGYSFNVRQTGNNKSGNDRQSFWILESMPQPVCPNDPNVEIDDNDPANLHMQDGIEKRDANLKTSMEGCIGTNVFPLSEPNGNGKKRPNTYIPKPHIPIDCSNDEFIES